MNFSAVILAGGKSKRMGRDKAWLTLRGKPLITRQVELVRNLGAAEIFISGRAEADYSALDCPILTDHFDGAGPLAGIEAALRAGSTPLMLVLAVDMARMNPARLQTLLANCTENCGAVPRLHAGIEPLAAVYPRSALGLVRQLLGQQSYTARHFAERCVQLKLASLIDMPDEHSEDFENWNTPLDVSDAGG